MKVRRRCTLSRMYTKFTSVHNQKNFFSYIDLIVVNASHILMNREPQQKSITRSPDSIPNVLHGQAFCQPNDSGLGSTVNTTTAYCPQRTADRRHVDDRAPAKTDHLRSEKLMNFLLNALSVTICLTNIHVINKIFMTRLPLHSLFEILIQADF